MIFLNKIVDCNAKDRETIRHGWLDLWRRFIHCGYCYFARTLGNDFPHIDMQSGTIDAKGVYLACWLAQFHGRRVFELGINVGNQAAAQERR